MPVSVTSHFHFFETNPRLDFPRAAAYGMRLAVPAGSSVRFGPGESAEVGLLPIGGERIAIGFAGLVDGPLDAPGAREEALRRAAACGYLGAGDAGDARDAKGAGDAGGAGDGGDSGETGEIQELSRDESLRVRGHPRPPRRLTASASVTPG